jgi:hypothetical protein
MKTWSMRGICVLVAVATSILLYSPLTRAQIALTQVLELHHVSDAGTAPDYCQNLQRQFDVAWPSHRSYRGATAARELRLQGELTCRQGRFHEGLHELKRALMMIGMKPVSRASPNNGTATGASVAVR